MSSAHQPVPVAENSSASRRDRLRPRRTVAILVAGWVALIAAAGVAVWFFRLDDEWNAQVLAAHCHDLPALPNGRIYGITVLALLVIAVCLLAWSLWRIVEGPTSHWWLVIPVLLAVVVAAGVALYALVILGAPTDPGDGTDGSGLPCGIG
ncbi:MAG: hypothetical protein QM658_12585 [Gordonia sp. (in: high G+C Gram-positive bacteria)]